MIYVLGATFTNQPPKNSEVNNRSFLIEAFVESCGLGADETCETLQTPILGALRPL